MTPWHDKLYDRDSALRSIHSPAYRKQARLQVQKLIRFLKLQKNHKILDVPCGTGRHVHAFARRGLNITGVDINPELLKVAKTELKKSHLKARLQKGNMIDLSKYKSQYDLVTNLFSSIGYFENDLKNKRAIREMFRCLNPGGTLVLDTSNRTRLEKIFSPVFWNGSHRQIIAEIRNYNPKTKYNEGIQCFVDCKTGKAHAHYHRVRLYDSKELIRTLKQMGARNIRVYSDLDGSPHHPTKHRRIIIFAQR